MENFKRAIKDTCLIHTATKNYWIDTQSTVIKQVMKKWQFMKLPTLELIEKDNKVEIKRDKTWVKSTEIEAIEDYEEFSDYLERLLERHETRIAEEV